MELDPPALEVRDLNSGYGETRVIDNVSLRINPGRRIALLGRNGAGKTTFVATLMGLTRRHSGEIRFGAVDAGPLSTAERARLGIGYVPQTRDVFKSLTVEENLFVGLNGRPRSNLAHAYEMFPRLFERRGNLASRLSGGEQQMLSIARTLLGEPSLLLLDEPLEGLAPVICDSLMDTLTKVADAKGMTVLLIEQQIERALRFAETVYFLERGRITWSGSALDARSQPDVIERYVGLADFNSTR